jgi:putative zinc finger/helix-turn-helix YgiT family protein
MIRCIECGRADLQPKVISLEGVVRGENYVVQMRGLECPKCGYKTIEGPDTPEFARLLSDKYRAAHNLLTSEQIRGLRKSFKENQEQFARRLGVGIASVKRWEMGKIQDERSNAAILEKTKVEVTNLGQYEFAANGGTTVTCTFCKPTYVSGTSVDLPGTSIWYSVCTDRVLHVPAPKSRIIGTTMESVAPWIYSARGRHAR